MFFKNNADLYCVFRFQQLSYTTCFATEYSLTCCDSSTYDGVRFDGLHYGCSFMHACLVDKIVFKHNCLELFLCCAARSFTVPNNCDVSKATLRIMTPCAIRTCENEPLLCSPLSHLRNIGQQAHAIHLFMTCGRHSLHGADEPPSVTSTMTCYTMTRHTLDKSPHIKPTKSLVLGFKDVKSPRKR